MIYLYGNRYETLIWVLVEETEWSSDVLKFAPDCVGGKPIHDGVVQQVDITCLGRNKQNIMENADMKGGEHELNEQTNKSVLQMLFVAICHIR